MANIFRQAYEIVTNKTGDEMTEEELILVAHAMLPLINEVPRIIPEFDTLPISEGLLRLAKIIEGENNGN